MAQLVKNPPAMRETWIQSLGWEDLLEKEKATHSSILAWRIPMEYTVQIGTLWVTKSQTGLSTCQQQHVFLNIRSLKSHSFLVRIYSIWLPLGPWRHERGQ